MRFVLIAAKQLALAKNRLALALPAGAERAALAAAMYRDVLAAALGSQRADYIAVVTSDPALSRIAAESGAIWIDEGYPRGLNAAVRLATARLMTIGASVVCTVLSDIPLTQPDDIDAAFDALPESGSGVSLIPSHDFSGTNIIARQAPDVIETQFGRLSLIRHRNECRGRGIPCAIVRRRGPALDLDTPADLIQFTAAPNLTHTFTRLAELGIAHR